MDENNSDNECTENENKPKLTEENIIFGRALYYMCKYDSSENIIKFIDKVNISCLGYVHKIDNEENEENESIIKVICERKLEDVGIHILNKGFIDINEDDIDLAYENNMIRFYKLFIQLEAYDDGYNLEYFSTSKGEEIAIAIIDRYGEKNRFVDSLYFACENKLESLALRLLDFPSKCFGTKYNMTPLEAACANKLTTVALKMLQYPEYCNIDHTYKSWSAFEYAAKHNMYEVVGAICNIKQNLKQLNYEMEVENFNKIKEHNEKYNNEVKKREISGNCLGCTNENDKYWCYYPCKHTINACDECNGKISTCPICRKNIDKQENVFLAH